jgi:hypothetical protein
MRRFFRVTHGARGAILPGKTAQAARESALLRASQTGADAAPQRDGRTRLTRAPVPGEPPTTKVRIAATAFSISGFLPLITSA